VLHDEGAGAPDASPNDSGTNSQVMVSLNRETCRYDVSVSVRVLARETLSTGNESHEYIYNIGDYRADWRPVTSTQSWTETADFTAHTEEWGLVYEGDAYFPGSTGTLIFDEHFAEEGKAGVARVRWAMELVY